MAETSLKITAWAYDNASGPLKEVGKAVGKLPEGLSKASSALSAMGGASQALGGQLAAATGKISQLASLVATGGPLGLGIAAVAAAVAAGAVVWQTYKESEVQAESATRSLAGVFEHQRDVLERTASRVQSLEEKLRNFGKTASETELSEAQRAVRQYSSGIESARTEIEKLEAENKKLNASTHVVITATKGYSRSQVVLGEDIKEQLRLNNMQLEGARKTEAHLKNLTQTEQGRADVAQQLLTAEAASSAAKAVNENLEKRGKLSEQAGQKRKRLAEEVERDAAKEAASETRLAEIRKRLDDEISEQKDRSLAYQVDITNKAWDEQAAAAKDYAEKVEEHNRQIIESSENAARRNVAISERVGDALGTSIAVSIQQAKTLEQTMQAVGASMIDVILDVAQQMIMMAAAKAAAEAYVSQAGIPVVGPLLGAAAAAAAFGFVRAYLSQVRGMADGGLVTGGRQGEDSVPAMLMPGEVVLSVPQVRAIRSLTAGTSTAISGSGGLALAGGGTVPTLTGGQVLRQTNVHVSFAVPATRSQVERQVQRVMVPALQRAERNGRYRPGRGR